MKIDLSAVSFSPLFYISQIRLLVTGCPKNKIEGKIKRLVELGTFTANKIILSRVVNL